MTSQDNNNLGEPNKDNADLSDLAQTPGEVGQGERGAEASLPTLVVGDGDDCSEDYWYKNVYQGDKVPQLTLRAVLMGGLLGAVMSISNLYTMLKVGWAFGVAITALMVSRVAPSGTRI